MSVFNITNPPTLMLIVIATVLLIFLSREIKKSYVVAIPLGAFLALLIYHVVVFTLIQGDNTVLIPTVTKCIAMDCILIFLTFFSYLWVDDIEAKEKGKKSYDNSLDWFWKKI